MNRAAKYQLVRADLKSLDNEFDLYDMPQNLKWEIESQAKAATRKSATRVKTRCAVARVKKQYEYNK